MTVARLTVKRGIGRNQNAFDECAIRQFPEKFLGDVARTLLGHQFQRLERIIFLELRAQFFRQIRHRVPARDVADIEPFEQLRHAINGLLPGFELGFEFVAGQRFDVSQHADRLNRDEDETKR